MYYLVPVIKLHRKDLPFVNTLEGKYISSMLYYLVLTDEFGYTVYCESCGVINNSLSYKSHYTHKKLQKQTVEIVNVIFLFFSSFTLDLKITAFLLFIIG